MAGLTIFPRFYFLVFMAIAAPGYVRVAAAPSPVKAAYWPSWDSSFPASAIDTSLFTHVYYAFLLPNNVTFKFDISKSTALLLKNFTNTLGSKDPPVKTLFSIGGATVEDPFIFSRMASNFKSRRNFIISAIEVARKFGFDGVDFDWEFPQSPKEMQNLGYLLDQWRAELESEAWITHRPPLLFTAAVYYAADFSGAEVYRAYPIASINRNLDWISAMCFDYHGSWNVSVTGAHAALFDPTSKLSTSYGLKSWIKAGVPPNKVVMGLPLYGRTWQLRDPSLNGVGAPAVGIGPGGDGVMTFSQVEEFNEKNGATLVYDVDTMSTYSYVGTAWIGYDDAISASMKIGFAQALGLRGYFFWAVNGDNQWKISAHASRVWILDQ